MDLDFVHARQYSGRSALINPLAVCALALRAVAEPEACAVVRGWVPPRLTVFLVDELVELDRWLEQSLPPDTLAELKARGRALNHTEIHALVHQMIDQHLG